MTFRTRTIAAAAAVIVAVGFLAGCTGPTPEPTPTGTTKATVSPGVTDITHAPGSGPGLVGAASDAKTASCKQDGSSWVATGTVKNPTDKTVDYRIYVSLLNGANDTRGVQEVDVADVAAGATADWKSSIKVPDKDLTCVLRVERYAK
jgi:hypothetical protein